jgi:drug/metabolite transporter (DMT)-like permease
MRNKITLKIFLFLIFSDILETFAHFCFKKSALAQSGLFITSPQDAFMFLKSIISSGFLWLGLASVVSEFTVWCTVLSKIDLSVAVPVASFSYILVPLVSVFIFCEKISLLRWLGIFFILTGVICVSKTTGKEGAPAG